MQVRKVKEATSDIHEERQGPYFQLNSPNNSSANRPVVDLNHCT